MDDKLKEVIELILEENLCSVSLLQRRLMLGYNRACRIMDEIKELGIIGESNGAKPREIIITDMNIINDLLC